MQAYHRFESSSPSCRTTTTACDLVSYVFHSSSGRNLNERSLSRAALIHCKIRASGCWSTGVHILTCKLICRQPTWAGELWQGQSQQHHCHQRATLLCSVHRPLQIYTRLQAPQLQLFLWLSVVGSLPGLFSVIGSLPGLWKSTYGLSLIASFRVPSLLSCLDSMCCNWWCGAECILRPIFGHVYL